ncbi:hypothetical protein CTA1_11064 [Colletotrichum tanaceti]|uniref:Uncharacterized protein n=1 Tax=Colletotrichum tanaceti TaxID=1306861 RepID=A0A4U6XLA1_9PEZI|nr:hypothetical protein CTA1_11064 [Colletotrichum tanaceti]
MENNMICPFCGKAGSGEYEMLLHMESFHPEEGSSHFPSPSLRTPNERYGECPIDGCGEIVSLAEMDYHVDLHLEEERQVADSPDTQATIESQSSLTTSATATASGSRPAGVSTFNRQMDAVGQWNKLMAMPPAKPMGKEGERRLGVHSSITKREST